MLPLSMYIEFHDILFLQSVMDGKYNVKDESIPVSLRNSNTRQSSDFELSKNRQLKTDENCWTRAPELFNILHYQFHDNPRKTTDRTLLQLQLLLNKWIHCADTKVLGICLRQKLQRHATMCALNQTYSLSLVNLWNLQHHTDQIMQVSISRQEISGMKA